MTKRWQLGAGRSVRGSTRHSGKLLINCRRFHPSINSTITTIHHVYRCILRITPTYGTTILLETSCSTTPWLASRPKMKMATVYIQAMKTNRLRSKIRKTCSKKERKKKMAVKAKMVTVSRSHPSKVSNLRASPVFHQTSSTNRTRMLMMMIVPLSQSQSQKRKLELKVIARPATRPAIIAVMRTTWTTLPGQVRSAK